MLLFYIIIFFLKEKKNKNRTRQLLLPTTYQHLLPYSGALLTTGAFPAASAASSARFSFPGPQQPATHNPPSVGLASGSPTTHLRKRRRLFFQPASFASCHRQDLLAPESLLLPTIGSAVSAHPHASSLTGHPSTFAACHTREQ